MITKRQIFLNIVDVFNIVLENRDNRSFRRKTNVFGSFLLLKWLLIGI